MSRYIAFDWGAKRTGIAVTDSNLIIATPLKTVETKGLHAEIVRLMNDAPCGGFVVGVPGLMVGGQTDSSAGINQFILYLEKTYPSLKVHQVDEGDTSNEAMSAMISGGMNKKNRRQKGTLDKVAAAIILQRFLESR
ncbi:MAG: Holliday junction resolvase RuvX [Flavobacteriales bacterium]|nr:Holliday junction resolvase RuvX [Flavobacteriales bacterium]